jgi:protein N-terminal glutamine amidohydrolase
VIWDYHVILHHAGKIYDFDSTLAFPCEVTEYIKHTLHPEVTLKAEFQRFALCSVAHGRMYRLVPAEVFLENFASDRSHMLSDGEWRAPIPSWPAIQNQGTL